MQYLQIAIIDVNNPPAALVEAAGRSEFEWGEVVNGCKVYPCHDAQLDVLASPARFTFAFAGTGGGKSVLIPLWFSQLFKTNKDKGRYLIVIPDYNKLDQSGILEGLESLFDGTAYKGKYSPQRHVYTCGNGIKIYIRSAKYPEAIEGGHYDGLALDEIKEIPVKAWRYAKSRVDQRKAPVLGVTTPDINGWFYKEIYKPCDIVEYKDVVGPMADAARAIGYDPKLYNVMRTSSDGSYCVRQWPSVLNNTYSVDAFLDAFRTMSKPLFERRYMGAFSTIDGLIYETFIDSVIDNDGKIPTRLPSEVLRVGFAIDWGWSPDPTCILVGLECHDGVIYIVEETYANKISNEQIKERIAELKRRWCVEDDEGLDGGRFIGLYCDSSEPKTIEYLRSNGINAMKKNVPIIETGIALVDNRMRSGYLKVYDCCRNLIDESSQYVRTVDREGDLTKPKDKHNHAMDTLRYLITAFDYRRNLKFGKKAEEIKAESKIEKGIRLGLLPDDPTVAAATIKDREEKRAKDEREQWFIQMLHADSD